MIVEELHRILGEWGAGEVSTKWAATCRLVFFIWIYIKAGAFILSFLTFLFRLYTYAYNYADEGFSIGLTGEIILLFED